MYIDIDIDHFPKSKIDSDSRFEIRMSIFLFLFFLKRFGRYLKKVKNGFPIVFSKSDLTGVGYIFWQKFLFKKPNNPK